jgi:glycosyltransferase involved in cell wall biosynthesis
MDRGTVSVIIPVRNGERYLAEALGSVRAQSYRHLEVLVVDDGSEDGTAEVVRRARDPRVRYVYQEPGGAAAARNHGIRLARGHYLAFLDADDLWDENKLGLQVAALAGPGSPPDMVFGHARAFAGHPAELPAEPGAPRHEVPGYSSGTLLIGMETFRRVGFFDARWRVGEFIDWYLRAVEAGLTHVMLPDVVLHRRIHGDNVTRRAGAARSDYARVVAAAIARRRVRRAPAGRTAPPA